MGFDSMNVLQMIREIKEKGLRESCFRFIMVLPRKFLGKGRSFNDISGKGDQFDRGTSWYRDDCKIPMPYVLGVELLRVEDGYAYLSLLVDKKDVRHFSRKLGEQIKSNDYDISIEEYENVV